MIEVANHADSFGVGCPDGEVDAAKTVVRPDVGAQSFVVAIVCPLGQQMKIEVGEQRPEGVRIDKIPGMPFLVLHPEPIREGGASASEFGFEEAIRMDSLHRDQFSRLASGKVDDPGVASLRKERPDHPGLQPRRVRRQLVNPQDRERVPVVGMNDQIDLGLRRRGYRLRQHGHDY